MNTGVNFNNNVSPIPVDEDLDQVPTRRGGNYTGEVKYQWEGGVSPGGRVTEPGGLIIPGGAG